MRTSAHALALAALALLGACGGREESAPGPGVLREIDRSEDRLWTGVAVSERGRVFLCYPRWVGPHEHSVVERLPGGRLKPYPMREPNLWRPGVTMPMTYDAWVCVQSVRCAGEHLFVLDAGSPSFSGVLPEAAKLARISLSDDRLAGVWHFDETVAPRRAYLNDVRVDVARRTAYVTDSGLGAILVVDLAGGTTRRLLDGHPSTQADPDVFPRIEDHELRFPAPPGGAPTPVRVHADGLALDASGDWLYWQALTGKTLWRAPTAVLRDPTKTPAEVGAAVERVATTVVSDGLEMDADGTIYFTAIEQGAIVARRADGTMTTLVADPRLAWPDSLSLTPRGTLYVTTSQLHRTPLLHGPTSMPRTPFLLLETGRLPPAPARAP